MELSYQRGLGFFGTLVVLAIACQEACKLDAEACKRHGR
jgi:hypothetical protein